MDTPKIAFIGECMVELQTKEGEIKQSFGGDTLNTALYLSRFSPKSSLDVHYVTALGQDPFSESMLDAWHQEDIKTDLVMRIADKNPGIYYIETDDSGERTFHYWRSDAAAKYLFSQPETPELLAQLMDFDAIYLSGISLAILSEEALETLVSFLGRYKENGGKVIFDNNYRPKLWASVEATLKAYKNVLSLTDTALLTFDDELDLYGEHSEDECIKRTLALGVTEIVIKRGAEACILVTNGEIEEVAALKVETVVDTSAAGDSFSAGFLAKRLLDAPASEAAVSGHVLAASVIQYKGAVIPKDCMPTCP